jgi:hypothetical protein
MIEGYSMGRIIIDGRAYGRDVLIFPDRVDATWWRVRGHELAVADLEEVLADPPEVLVVGTGQYGRMVVLPETKEALAAWSVHLIVQPTESACQTYNKVIAEGRHVVAALHLTC